MARIELMNHRKFLRLRTLLGEPTPHVYGYLECLWHRGYQTGNPIVGNELDVECAAEYPGQRGVLFAALLESGFIDKRADGRYEIHDLYEHAPQFVKRRMKTRGTAPTWVYEQKLDSEERPDATSTLPLASQRSCSGQENRKTVTNSLQTAPIDKRSKNKDKSISLKPSSASPTPPENPPAKVPPENPPEPPAKTKTAHALLFDAIVEVTGQDAKLVGSAIGGVAKQLLAAVPPYTPEDVRRFGEEFWTHCPWAKDNNRQRPTPGEITKNIALIRATPPAALAIPPPAKPKFRSKAEMELDFAADSFLGAMSSPEETPCQANYPKIQG
jgi:hypothetical protein